MKNGPLEAINKEEYAGPGRGPRPTPTTREVPPTDEELLFIDRLRKADAIGAEAFMMTVMAGNDINKPTTINAVMDIMRHLERLEKRAQATDERLTAHVMHLNNKIKDTEKMVGEEIKGLEALIREARDAFSGRLVVLARSLDDAEEKIAALRSRLPWWCRRGKDRPVPPKSEHVAPTEAGAGK